MVVNKLNLIRGDDIKVNDNIVIHHPTLNEICDIGESKYMNVIYTLCATPSDCKSIIYDSFGAYFNEFDEFKLFCLICAGTNIESELIIKDIKFSDFSVYTDEKNEIMLANPKTGIIIDRKTYIDITDCIRSIFCMTKNIDNPMNDRTRDYMINKDRRERTRNKNKNNSEDSLGLGYIIPALINCRDFKYNYENVWDLKVFNLYNSIKHIRKFQKYDNVMKGVYGGMIDTSKMDLEKYDWLKGDE